MKIGKRIFEQHNEILREQADGTLTVSTKGYEKKWLFGIKIWDNKWDDQYVDLIPKKRTGF